MNNGRVNLENITSVQGARQDDWLRFHISNGGQIDLSSLLTITGRVRVKIEVPEFSLPNLERASVTRFDLGTGATLNMPSLIRLTGNGGWMGVPAAARVNAGALQSMDYQSVSLAVGGRIDAPNLRSFTRSWVRLGPGKTFNVPAFDNFDNSTLLIDGAATYAVAAPSYLLNWADWRTHATILQAKGIGALLDLSSVETFRVPAWGHSGSWYYKVSASDLGVLDLSGVSAATGAGQDDWLHLKAQAGGVLRLGDLSTSARVYFSATDANSKLDFKGLNLFRPSQVGLSVHAVMSIARDFQFNNTNENEVVLLDGIVHMDGAARQWLEVGGTELGLPDGGIPRNFQFGQLIVGRDDQPTTVHLTEDIDNGNRGEDVAEALYLQGFPQGLNGLRIRGGSTLMLNRLNVYVVEDDEWVHLNELFEPGENVIGYDGGFIQLVGFGSCDLNCDGSVDLTDTAAFITAMLDADEYKNQYPDCDINNGDTNRDGSVDLTDVEGFIGCLLG